MSMTEFNPDFESLLSHLKRARGFDFTGYKRPSLVRRIDKRMQSLKLENYDNYIDYLEIHQEEYSYLFNTILINVTGFFRDQAAWEYLADEVLPLIINNNNGIEMIRVWSAGCATGQEAYSSAIILSEKLGVEAFGERVKIYATDLDNEALQIARQGIYKAKAVEDIPGELLEKYFEEISDSYVFRKDLRRSIIFGRHDLVQDAPISRIDLLICRNTLMYFNAETQSKILARFHFALKDSGFLMLGKAEMLFSYANLFTPHDLKRRVFTKMPRVSFRERLLQMDQSIPDVEDNAHLTRYMGFREVAFNASPLAQIVIDFNDHLIMANERARVLLNVNSEDLSRSFQELDVMYRLPELRTRLDEVRSDRRTVTIKDVKWLTASGDTCYLDVQIVPLIDHDRRLMGASIAFIEMTAYYSLQEELESANQELDTAYEELQTTNEELETTNEELQSTIEELETTNEELQSTNEELETINEEFQSTNEELQTINDETNRRSEEIIKLNHILEAILSSLRSGVVVLNQSYQIQIWSDKVENLWGLRYNEVSGKSILNLDIGLPAEKLVGLIHACLLREQTTAEMLLDATNRRGKQIACRVTCAPLVAPGEEDVTGVILLMEEVDS